MQSEENLIGEVLGQLYVKEFFTPVAKKRYEDMTEGVREALRERIKTLTWMSDSTKQKAYAKLSEDYDKKKEAFNNMAMTYTKIQNVNAYKKPVSPIDQEINSMITKSVKVNDDLLNTSSEILLKNSKLKIYYILI